MAADFCCATLELAVIDHLRQQGANHLPLPFVTLADQQAAEMLADILWPSADAGFSHRRGQKL